MASRALTASWAPRALSPAVDAEPADSIHNLMLESSLRRDACQTPEFKPLPC